MIGFPDETRQQIIQTAELALRLDTDELYISLATPLPGTPLYDECVRRDLLYDDFDINNVRFSVANIKLPDTGRGELERIRRNTWLQHRNKQASKAGRA